MQKKTISSWIATVVPFLVSIYGVRIGMINLESLDPININYVAMKF
jgi:hypothetical protein